ncbi:HEPN/Toprim-associated domain-containing protein [Micromonospora taraxaci]|uniref:HEPN/Toprim-associated domain-containing protein n=1 Tax=Micromonospora taraxaci TaxID=1316803 RepID=UPI0032450CD2
MGEYWTLTSGRVTLLRGRNYVPDKVMALFRESDRRVDRDLLREYESLTEENEIDPRRFDRMIGYEISTSAFLARLALMGFDPTSTRREVLRYLSEELEGEVESEEDEYVFRSRWETSVKAQVGSVRALLNRVIAWVKSHDGWSVRPRSRDSLDSFCHDIWEDITEGYDDPRFALALLSTGLRKASIVRLELTRLMQGGWMERDELLATTAQRRMKAETASSGQIIVVTEGSTDAHLIRTALKLVAPEIADYYSFLDFHSTDAPGGVDRVVSLTRGLAAAGVMNRVLAVLDNDCAGRLGERALLTSSLPDTFGVMRLPDVSVAEAYPSLGPDGQSFHNVNGRACTIEFMFGRDVLEQAHGGELPPVRWKSFIQPLNDYQGEVLEKRKIQQVLRSTLESENVPHEALAGAEILVRRIIDNSPTVLGPVASDTSPLLLPRARESEAEVASHASHN